MKKQAQFSVCHHILSTVEEESAIGNVYLGGHGSLKEEIIIAYRIGAILTVMDSYMYEKLKIKEKVQANGIETHKWIDVEDDEEVKIDDYFGDAQNFMLTNLPHTNVLVHCQAGMSRSATIVISFVMKIRNISSEAATKFVRSQRYVVSPNQGFVEALQRYEKKLDAANNEPSKDIFERPSLFQKQEYKSKYYSHIICLNEQSLQKQGNLFLGQVTALSSHIISKLHIASVLTVMDQGFFLRYKIKQKIEHLGISNFKWIEIKDKPDENIQKWFAESNQFIEEALKTGNVLVHCQAGVSRSASITIAFLMKYFKTSYENALKFVQRKRHVVCPNNGFQLQLQQYEKDL